MQACDGLNGFNYQTNPLNDIVTCNYLEIDSYDRKLNTSELSVIQLNVRGLISKQHDLCELINKLKHKVHVIILCETWLTETNKKLINIPGYKLISKERTNKKGGGVGFLIDEKLIFRVRTELEMFNNNMEQITVEIKGCQENIMITSIYRPPNTTSNKFVKEYGDLLTDLKSKGNNIIIGLDHNLDLLKQHVHSCTNEFLQKNFDNGLIPAVNIPTRITKNSATLIDNIMMSTHLHSKASTNLLLSDISDHLPSICIIDNVNHSLVKNQFTTSRKLTEKTLKEINDVLASHDWTVLLNSNDVNENFNIWRNTVLNCIDKIAPEKRRKLNPKKQEYSPWLTKGIKNSSRKKNKLYKEWLTDRTNTDKHTNYNEYRRLLQKIKRVSKKEYFNNKCLEYKHDSKKLWNLINKINGRINDKTSIIDKIIVENLEITDTKLIADKFADFFGSVESRLARQIGKSTHSISYYNKQITCNDKSLYFYPTDEEEIKTIINGMISKTSTGFDGISNKLLKSIKNSILTPLTIIFNQSMSLGVFPEEMKLAEIVPLFKSKSPETLNNYRPISLLITASKILEKIIYKRTYNFLVKSKQLFVSQYGFRQNHSCNDAVNELGMYILKNIEENKYTVSIFLDLSKAFDTLDHEILLQKMSKYGIRGLTNDWFLSYLSNRKIKCKLNDKHGNKIRSKSCNIEYGAPQGSCLGPLLFLIFINDLPKHVKYCSAILFADDTTIYNSSKYPQYLKWCIEEDLKRLNDWFKANKLTLNLEKSQLLIFEPPGKKFDEKICFDGIEIKRYNVAKFLGITLDDRFRWDLQFNNVLLKTKRNLHMLRTSQNIMSIQAKKLIYFGHIQSHITYCLNTWGNFMTKEKINQLQKIQNKCLKLIFGNFNHGHNRKQNNILSINGLIMLENYKFAYKYVHRQLPPRLTTSMECDSKNKCLLKKHGYNTRNKNLPNAPLKMTNKYRLSLLYNSINLYNKLQDKIKKCKSLKSFIIKCKHHILNING